MASAHAEKRKGSLWKLARSLSRKKKKQDKDNTHLINDDEPLTIADESSQSQKIKAHTVALSAEDVFAPNLSNVSIHPETTDLKDDHENDSLLRDALESFSHESFALSESWAEFFEENAIKVEAIRNDHLLSHMTVDVLDDIESSDLEELCLSLGLSLMDKIKMKHAVKQLKEQNSSDEIEGDADQSLASYRRNPNFSVDPEPYLDPNVDEEDGCEVFKYPVVIFGDTNVGKSSICDRMVRNQFDRHSPPTLFTAKNVKVVRLKRDVKVSFVMWDVPGQEQLRSMGVMHYRGAFAIIIVFDMTQPETFETAKYWLEEVQDKAIGYDKILVVANKKDMSKQRAISTSEAMRYAVRHGATYIETSAKTGYNIDVFFDWLRQQSADKYERDGATTKNAVTLDARTATGSSATAAHLKEIKTGTCCAGK